MLRPGAARTLTPLLVSISKTTLENQQSLLKPTIYRLGNLPLVRYPTETHLVVGSFMRVPNFNSSICPSTVQWINQWGIGVPWNTIEPSK